MALTKVIGSGVQGISNSSDATAMTIGSDEVVDFASNADFIDGRGIRLGAGNDFQLYHDGTDNHINVTGAQTLNIQTSGNNAIVVDANGIITKPLQPAFLARGTTQNNMAVGSDVTIVLSTEVFDQNADYNNGTYTFTAPITGRYQLNMNLYLTNLDTAANFYYGAIKTSNQFYYNLFDPGPLASDPVYWSLTMSVLADMDANDTASVVFNQANGGQQTDSTTHSHFLGYLVA